MKQWCLSCCHAVVSLQTTIKYSTVPYLGRFVQWCLSVTVLLYAFFILQSLTCQSNHLLFCSICHSHTIPDANGLAAKPMLFCSICQLNGCVFQTSWTITCPIALVFGLGVFLKFALHHLELGWSNLFMSSPVDDNHSKRWWPSYSLRTYAHGPKWRCQYTQAFAPFFQFVVIANLSPSILPSPFLSSPSSWTPETERWNLFLSGWPL